jgi:hypothetical protein
MRLSELEVDAEAIEKGAERDAVGLPGVKLVLRGVDNYDWRRLQAKLIAEIPREKRLVRIDPEDDDRITGQLLLQASVIGWSGIQDKDGAEMPFSVEAATIALTDPRYKRFRQSALATAQLLAEETLADREAAAKN